MMRARYLFFAFLAAQAVPGRFSSLFLQSHGLSESEIGAAFAAGNLVALVATPFFSQVADRATARETVVMQLNAISAVLFSLQALALPSVGVIPAWLRFPYLLLVRGMFSVAAKPILPIVTGICVAQLKDKHGPEGARLYGRERLWGTISWAGFSVLEGAVLDVPGIGVTPIYIANFTLCCAFIAMLAYFRTRNRDQHQSRVSEKGDETQTASTLQQRRQHEDRGRGEVGDRQPASILQTTRSVVFGNGIQSISFFAFVASLAIGMSLVARLQFLYFFNELQASNFMCGLAVVVTVLFEIPLLAQAPQLLETFGPVAMVTFAALTYAVRSIGYALVPNGWVVLILEPLHGVTFATMKTAAVAYVGRFAPPGADATAQSVLTLTNTIAAMVGLALGGIVMQIANGRVLYFTTGCIALIATALFHLARRVASHTDIDVVGRNERDECVPLAGYDHNQLQPSKTQK